MGRKRTAEEYFQTAEVNGWVAGAHEQEDQKVQSADEPGSRYKMNQQEALNQWIIFMSSKGVSEAECLFEGCPAPSNVLLKDFARWYCKSRNGRLDKRPTNTAVRNTVKKFLSGFQRVTKTKIPDQLRTDVYTFVRNTLINQGYCTTKKRGKDIFNDEDLHNCITSLWTDPDVVFMHEEMRGQITLLTKTYLFSGVRIGAFLHDFAGEVKGKDGKMEDVIFKGLTWKDVHIYLFPLPDGTTERILKLTQRWVKGNKDPENYIESQAVCTRLEGETAGNQQEKKILSIRLEAEQSDHATTRTQLSNCWKVSEKISNILSDMWTHLKDENSPALDIAGLLLQNEEQRCKILELQAFIPQTNNKRSQDQANHERGQTRSLWPAKRRSNTLASPHKEVLGQT